MDLKDIETLAGEYAEARQELHQRVDALRREIRRLKRGARPGIQSQAEHTAATKQHLVQAIDENRKLFNKPKSRIFHGIKVGLRKLRGKVVYDDQQAVIDRIRKHLSDDQAELLIRKKETVDKVALGELTVADLKRIGVRVEKDTDAPVVQATDTDLDKWIDSVLQLDDEEGAGDE